MASLPMTASFLPAAPPSSVHRRHFVPAKSATACPPKAAAPAAAGGSQEPGDKKQSNTRRGVMLAAAVAIWAASPRMAALAEEAEEPKPGTPEAKKKYFPVCVTMPTARICHK